MQLFFGEKCANVLGGEWSHARKSIVRLGIPTYNGTKVGCKSRQNLRSDQKVLSPLHTRRVDGGAPG